MLGLAFFVLLGVAPASAQVPVAAFDWRMPDRFGAKLPSGILDYHWHAAKAEYDPAFVRPQSWRVEFNACRSRGATFLWEIDSAPLPPTSGCTLAYQFPKLGTYPVRLTVKADNGRSASVTQSVVVKDWLIVSIGDSYASGEGNPDIHQKWSHGTISSGPKWVDRRCHRSAAAGPVKAALQIEQSDPRSSVTFLSFACSGATVKKGLTGEYDGVEPQDAREPLVPQLQQVAAAIGARQIDALIVSIGGNDIGFADVAKVCVENDADPLKKPCHEALDKSVAANLAELPTLYQELRREMSRTLRASAVFITEYPDPTYDDRGETCGVNGRRLLVTVRAASARWARDGVLGKLNQAIREAAATHGWIYVGDVASQFRTHGECAPDHQRWFRTEEDARNIQGPIDFGLSQLSAKDLMVSKGTLHPNVPGHEAYARRIVEAFNRVTNRSLHASPEALPRGEPTRERRNH